MVFLLTQEYKAQRHRFVRRSELSQIADLAEAVPLVAGISMERCLTIASGTRLSTRQPSTSIAPPRLTRVQLACWPICWPLHSTRMQPTEQSSVELAATTRILAQRLVIRSRTTLAADSRSTTPPARSPSTTAVCSTSKPPPITPSPFARPINQDSPTTKT